MVEKLCFIVLLLSAGLFAIGLTFGIGLMFFQRPQIREETVFFIMAVLGLTGVVCGIMLAERARRWPVPVSIGFIAKSPFQMSNVRKIR